MWGSCGGKRVLGRYGGTRLEQQLPRVCYPSDPEGVQGRLRGGTEPGPEWMPEAIPKWVPGRGPKMVPEWVSPVDLDTAPEMGPGRGPQDDGRRLRRVPSTCKAF